MSEKDFLSQFSGKNTVPESFREEERRPVNKQKKPVNKVLIIVLIVLALAVGLGAYFIFFAPKIEMPNFEGQTKNDVAAWVKQQGIETSGIIFEEDYYFDYDEGVIISQSIEPGKKVKENVKINFVSSLGADPDELIKTPDLMNMTKSEVQDWISEYKLTKTKVTTAYSDEVEEGNVISFAYSGCEEDTFTRSSTLKISVSKGPAPAGTIAVKDFVKGTYDAVETWATTNKVKVTKSEQYSDTIAKGYVVSQSIDSGKTMKEGETLTVVVSKGKAVKVIDFTDMNKTEITRWCTKNDVVAYITEEYSDVTESYYVTCTPKAGSTIATGDSIDIIVSLGNPNLATGLTSEAALKAAVETMNLSGAELTLVHDADKYDDNVAVGNLVYYETENEVGDHVHYYLSKGKNLYIESSYTLESVITIGSKSYTAVKWDDCKECEGTPTDNNYDEQLARALCEASGITYHISYEKVSATTADRVGRIAKITNKPTAGQYIGQDVTVEITIYSNN